MTSTSFQHSEENRGCGVIVVSQQINAEQSGMFQTIKETLDAMQLTAHTQQATLEVVQQSIQTRQTTSSDPPNMRAMIALREFNSQYPSIYKG